MAHASLRLLLPVALFSSCGKTLPVNIADPRTWFIDPNEQILSVNTTQTEISTFAAPTTVNLNGISSSSNSTNVMTSSQASMLSVIRSSPTELSQKTTELTSLSNLPISIYLPVENKATMNKSLSSRFNKSENNWRVDGAKPHAIPEISLKSLNFSASPTNTTLSQELLQVLPPRKNITQKLESATLKFSQNELKYSNISLQQKEPLISNASTTSKYLIKSEEKKVKTPHNSPAVSSKIITLSNESLTNETLLKKIPKFQDSEIEASKETLITPVNIFLSSNVTIPIQSTTTTELISPSLVPQVIIYKNITKNANSNTPMVVPRVNVETTSNISSIKEPLALKTNESSREAAVKVLVTPVNIFMSSQIYFQATKSVVPKIMVQPNNATSINNTKTESLVNISPSHVGSQKDDSPWSNSKLSNDTSKSIPPKTSATSIFLSPSVSTKLSNSESNNATSKLISRKPSASSIFLSPLASLPNTKAPIQHIKTLLNSHGNETTVLIENTKGSKRKRRLRGRQSTTTERNVLKNCSVCELCKRDKPICAKPVGVDGFDNQLRGFPSICHLDCSNNCRKIRYEKVADGRCGRLRDWFQPLGSMSRLNRAELNKLEYQVTPGSRQGYAFLPLS